MLHENPYGMLAALFVGDGDPKQGAGFASRACSRPNLDRLSRVYFALAGHGGICHHLYVVVSLGTGAHLFDVPAFRPMATRR
jgi:hypothetical protein